jgi:hypothetical protein
MLDILICVLLSRKIAAIVREKGRKPAGYVASFAALYFVGEISGLVLGFMLSDGEETASLLLFGVVGAAIGGLIGYLIANSAKPLPNPAYYTGGFPVMQPGTPNYGGYAYPQQQPYSGYAAPQQQQPQQPYGGYGISPQQQSSWQQR